MKKKVTFESAGHELSGILNVPSNTPAPGIVLFHGLSNTKEDCPMITETSSMLADEGFATFRFDFFGSGKSPGTMRDKTLSLLEKNAGASINFLLEDERVTEKIGLWGRSLGGTLVALVGDDSRVNVRTFLSASVNLKEDFGRFDRVKKLEMKAERRGEKLPGTGEYKGKFELNRDFFRELPRMEEKIKDNLKKFKNVLVLATTPDVKVSLKNATTIINHSRDPREIHIFEDVDHDYAGAEEEVLNIEKRWYKRFLPLSPT